MDQKAIGEGKIKSEEAVVQPGTTVIVSAFPVRRFACNQIVFTPLPASRRWRARCFAKALAMNFFNAVPNIITWLSGGLAVWEPFYAHPPDGRVVLDVGVGGLSQLAGHNEGVPAKVFYEGSLGGVAFFFDEAGLERPIAAAIMNKSKKPVSASFTAVGRYVL